MQNVRNLRLIIALAVLPVIARLAHAATVYVDASAFAGANDGSSWSDAYQGRLGLRAALLAAQPGDEIWVADGVYAPSAALTAGGSRADSFLIPDGVAVLGGFAGGETGAGQRDPALHVAVLTGDLNANDAVSANSKNDNSYHVVRMGEVGPGTIVSGVTIRDGNANGSFPLGQQIGANLLIEGGSPTVDRVITTSANGFTGAGGAVLGGAPVFTECLFSQNEATQRGGGLHAQGDATITLEHCEFILNEGGLGSGLSSESSMVMAHGTHFHDNEATVGLGSGAGFYNEAGEAHFERCEFFHNHTDSGGGAIYSDGGSITLDRCYLRANKGKFDGGDGIFLFGAHAEITNSLIVHHHGSGVGIMVHQGASLELLHCTMTRNSGTFGLGGITCMSGSASCEIQNSILWENGEGADNGYDRQLYVFAGAGTVNVNHSCITEWAGQQPGTGNIAGNPLLADPLGPDGIHGSDDDDFHLLPGSPAIDAANNTLAAGLTLDFDGLARFFDDPATIDTGAGPAPIADMGALEFGSHVPTLCPGDTNGDMLVDFADLNHLLANWGMMEQTADLDGSGTVDFADLNVVLTEFGSMC